MPDGELQKILGALPPGGRRRGPQTFRLGDTVRILSGPFAAFTGRVEGINQSKSLLKVVVNIFGRTVPLKLSFADAEKVSF
jgi:transcriptional antiterminator NusG